MYIYVCIYGVFEWFFVVYICVFLCILYGICWLTEWSFVGPVILIDGWNWLFWMMNCLFCMMWVNIYVQWYCHWFIYSGCVFLCHPPENVCRMYFCFRCVVRCLYFYVDGIVFVCEFFLSMEFFLLWIFFLNFFHFFWFLVKMAVSGFFAIYGEFFIVIPTRYFEWIFEGFGETPENGENQVGLAKGCWVSGRKGGQIWGAIRVRYCRCRICEVVYSYELCDQKK